MYDRRVQCQRAGSGGGPAAARVVAVVAVVATFAALANAACVSGPAIGGGQPLRALTGEGRTAAVALSAELIFAAVGADVPLSLVPSLGEIDLERELTRVARVELALGGGTWLAVVRPRVRFPARFIGWSVSATAGFRFHRATDAEPALAYWRGNGHDLAVFDDALVIAPSLESVDGRERSALASAIDNLRRADTATAASPAVELYLADFAGGIATLAGDEAGSMLSAIVRAVPVTVVEVTIAHAEYDDTHAVAATLSVARPPASRYAPLVRLALLPLLAELQIPGSRVANAQVTASTDDSALHIVCLTLSDEELARILREVVAGIPTAVAGMGPASVVDG